MSNLAKHIEILLLDNDCVIVPGFGGFMAHRVDSVYVEEENVFLPPSRTLGFNPQLHVNDSLLALSYVEALDISYPEALKIIEDDVRDIKKVLSNEGRYDLPDIGELSVNDEGNYVFSPCTSGILTPGLYALSSFEMPKLAGKNSIANESILSQEEKKNKRKISAVKEEKNTEKTEINKESIKHTAKIISLNKDLIRTAVALAVIILTLVFGIMPIGDSSKTTQQLCTIDTSLLQKMMPQMQTTSVDEIKPTNINECNSTEAINETQEVEEPVNEASVKKTEEKVFVIVLASGVTRKNAEAYISSVKNQNVDDARIISKGTLNYIVCGAFNSKDEAYNKANELRSSKSLFADVWVMETKN